MSDTKSICLDIVKAIEDISRRLEAVSERLDLLDEKRKISSPTVEDISKKLDAISEKLDLLDEERKEFFPTVDDISRKLDAASERVDLLDKKQKKSFQAEFKKNLNKITGSSFLKAIGLAGTLTGFGNLIGTTILSCMGENPSLDKRQVMLMNWGILAAVFVIVLAFSAFNHFYQNKQNNEQKPDSNIAESTVTESSDCKRSSFSS